MAFLPGGLEKSNRQEERGSIGFFGTLDHNCGLVPWPWGSRLQVTEVVLAYGTFFLPRLCCACA